MRKILYAVLLGSSILSSGAAYAAGGAEPLPEHLWSFDGVLGKFDQNQLQRGFQIYKEVCSSCHSLSRVAYRNLADLGYNEAEIKAIAAGAMVKDGPNDMGDMFERAGLPSDRFVPPFANENAARAANGGAYPPDLSLITKARHGGADYVKALLTGYSEPPAGIKIPDGKYYNKYFDGHQISMAPPLSDGQVTYADGSPETLEQYSSDIAAFLTWTAEPKLEARKQAGLRVMLFLSVMTVFLYLAKQQIWARVKKK